jgi:seryl-tRNA synthetase
MNRLDLKNLKYLDREIKRLRQRVEELQTAAESCTQQLTGMPKSRKANDLRERLIETKEKYENLIAERELQKIAIENELYEIDDVLIREIFMRKFVDGCSWGQTARKVGGMNTRDSVRKMANRFMKRKGWN